MTTIFSSTWAFLAKKNHGLSLTDRTWTLTVNGQSSRSANVFLGVPQGSVLGPIRFILYLAPRLKLIPYPTSLLLIMHMQLLQSGPDQLHATVLTMHCILASLMGRPG